MSFKNMTEEELYQYGKELYIQNKFEDLSKLKQWVVEHKKPTQTTDNSYIPYPSLDDPLFHSKIANKTEFARNKHKVLKGDFTVLANEKCNHANVFRLSENQKFLKGFMSPLTPYKGLLIYHGTGVGKTCTAIGIAEQFNDIFKKKAIVILPSTLHDNFYREVFDINKLRIVNGAYDLNNIYQCTGHKYVKNISERFIIKKEALESAVKKLISKQYKLYGYIQFANYYNSLKQSIRHPDLKKKKNKNVSQNSKPSQLTEDETKDFDELLKEVYSDSVIIIDEAHNLRMHGNNEKDRKETSLALMHILRVAHNIRLILLTATPMFNSAVEIVFLLNLLLINDKRPTLKESIIFENEKLTTKGSEILTEVSKGYVSYMKGENPYSFPFRLLPSINKDANLFCDKDKPKKDIYGKVITKSNNLEKLGLIKSKIGEYQREIYDLMLKDYDHDIKDELVEEDDKPKKNMSMADQISIIVYPSPIKTKITDTYGEKGFHNCFDVVNNNSVPFSVSYKSLFANDEFLSYDNVEKYSPKIKTILDYILNSKGIVFVYSSYLYSGIIPLAIALEHVGLKRYGGNNILKKSKATISRTKNKEWKYIILSAKDNLSNNNIKEIEKTKTKENKNGDIIKVIIGSNVATEGIDFKNIREIHILNPWYHLNKLEQVFGRGIRNCSHIDLPLSERNVTIYQHVTIVPKSVSESVDVRIYRRADEKQIEINKVQNILRDNAIDCMLNKSAIIHTINDKISITTSQNKTIKDYEISSTIEPYSCRNEERQSKKDNSTFSTYFLKDDVDIYKAYITFLFDEKNKPFYTFTEIEERLINFIQIENDVLSLALELLITEGRLIYKSNKYYLPTDDLTTSLKKHKLNLLYLPKTENTVVETKHVENDIMKQIVIDIQERLTFLEGYGLNIETKKVRDSVIDFYIDRLDTENIKNIVLSNINKPNDELIESLKRGFMLYETQNHIRFLVLPSEQYYSISTKTNKIVKCTDLNLPTIKELEQSIQEELRNKYNMNEIKGYVSESSTGRVFKMIIDTEKGKTTGTVCSRTSKITVKDLREKITTLNDKFAKCLEPKKVQCDLYELLLRIYGNKYFLRPYEYDLITRSSVVAKKKSKKN